jgi:hypothetical protein
MADTPQPPSQALHEQDEWALKQYDSLLRYYSYEGQIYWARSQHFLVANAALFAFVATTKFPIDVRGAPWIQFVLLALICGAGLFLTHLWRNALLAGEFWLAHWSDLLLEREQGAFGSSRVLREFTTHRKRYRAKQVAHSGVKLFALLWCILLTLVIFAMLLKRTGYEFV